ncbi:TPA: hypothetical protein JD761_002490 [Legionella pneumophila subsp. pneumophila]|nr:hypothetical protein [Legionella pneumophila subsp. pneumophila]
MNNSDSFSEAWLPQPECRLLKQMYGIAGDGLQYLYYKRWFNENEQYIQQIDSGWYTYTVNGYYDLSLRNWCMLFGTYDEPTHYHKLLDYTGIKSNLQTIYLGGEIDKNKLREKLLESMSISFEDFCAYHKCVVEYRNKYLSHREHHPNQIKDGDLTYPRLDIARQSLLSIFFILIQILREYPNTSTKDNKYFCEYKNFNSIDAIEEYSTKIYPEKLLCIKK